MDRQGSLLIFDFDRAVNCACAGAGKRGLARPGYGHRVALLQIFRDTRRVSYVASPIAGPALRAGTGHDGAGVHVKRLRMPAAIWFGVGLDGTVSSGGSRATAGNQC